MRQALWLCGRTGIRRATAPARIVLLASTQAQSDPPADHGNEVGIAVAAA